MIKATTLCQLFVDENRWNYEESTIDTFALAWRHFVEAVGNREIDRIEPMDGEKFKGWVVETMRSKTSANMWLRAIKRILNWAANEKGYIDTNPLAGTKQMRITRNPVKFYEDDQVLRMIRFAPTLRWKAIILCGWTTGLRRGALLNLTQDNIRGGYVHVEAKRRTERTWPWEPKTKEIRRVPLVDRLAEWIDRLGCYYPFLPHRRYFHMLGLQERAVLTARRRKCPEENFRRSFVAIQRRAFGRQIGDFHMLRKTYVTNISGLPEQVLMSLSGHRDRRTLTYYTGVRQSMMDEARKIVSERLKNGHLLESDTRKPRAI